MNRIIPHIQYLLTQHDCIVIPGWGALITDTKSSRIEDNMIYPPKRDIGFNPELVHNDGLLVSSVAKREGISYSAASLSVTNAIEEMKSVYEITGKLSMPRIGLFEKGDADTPLFTPYATDNIANIHYFGLQPTGLQQIDKDIYSNNDKVDTSRLVPLKKAIRIAAAIIILFCLGITLTTPIVFEQDKHFQALVMLPKITGKSNNQITVPENNDSKSNMELFIAIPDPNDAIVECVQSWRMNSDDRYFLIVASYETKRQAEKYISNHPGEHLEILEYDGRNRVYAATGTTADEARLPMNNAVFSTSHPDGWVFRK